MYDKFLGFFYLFLFSIKSFFLSYVDDDTFCRVDGHRIIYILLNLLLLS